MDFDRIVDSLALAMEGAGIAVLIAGVLISSGVFIRDWVSEGLGPSYHSYRANLGRGILLGLELLVVGDIIGTVATEPTMESVAVLGVIVLIRTFLSFALEVEISGKLPWKRDPGTAPHHPGEESSA